MSNGQANNDTAGTLPAVSSRAALLDFTRGIAVLAMILYHFAWDLSHFGLIETDVGFHAAWKAFAKIIAASFLAIAGASLAYAARNGLDRRAFLKRLIKIGGAALLITAATFVVFPDRFIFFGILHCIAVSSVLALPFLRLPWIVTATVATLVITAPLIVALPALNHPALVWIGLGSEPPLSNDFEPLFPWLGWMLAGLAVARFAIERGGATAAARPSLISRIGRWSLVIYLVHQPLLFGAFMGAGKIGMLSLAPEIKPFVQSCAVDCENSGATYGVCTAACSCVARTLRDRPVWQRVIADRPTEQDTAELSMVGRRCYDEAAPKPPPARP